MPRMPMGVRLCASRSLPALGCLARGRAVDAAAWLRREGGPRDTLPSLRRNRVPPRRFASTCGRPLELGLQAPLLDPA
eukprot:2741179-Alexandrium_andersonii.AAC.1